MKKLFNKIFFKEEDVKSNIFYMLFNINTKYKNHVVLTLFGIELTMLRPEFLKERRTFKQKYQSYEKAELIPPAEGNLRLIQKADASFLKLFDEFCKENNLQYWMDFGTLLGAVRHKGFIPWDDDIDLGMLREDYERLITLLNGDCKKYQDFRLSLKSNNINNCFVKLHYRNINNISIDIFPYDKYISKLSDDEKLNLSNHIAKYTRLKWYKKFQRYSSTDSIRNHFVTITNDEILKNKNISTQTPAVFMGVDFPHKWKNKVYDWNTLFPLVKLNFEGLEFWAPNNSDKVLNSIYGAYMQIPKDSYPRHTTYINIKDSELKILKELAL